LRSRDDAVHIVQREEALNSVSARHLDRLRASPFRFCLRCVAKELVGVGQGVCPECKPEMLDSDKKAVLDACWSLSLVEGKTATKRKGEQGLGAEGVVRSDGSVETASFMTVAELKVLVAKATGVSTKQQRLLYNSDELKSDAREPTPAAQDPA
jgi:hypothetical protein